MREEKLERFSDFSKVNLENHYYLVYKPLIRDLQYSITNYANGRILDLGCGNKPYERLFKKNTTEYIGCDIIQSSQNKVDVICEVTDLPLDDSSFDTIFTTQVIEHVADHNKLLEEANRVLKPGGYIIVSGPLYWHLHEEPHDFFRFTKYGFQHILQNNGFDVVEILANGGKWATFGQMVIHTFPQFLVKRKWFRKINNYIFYRLDNKHYNDFNTMNYVVVGKKIK